LQARPVEIIRGKSHARPEIQHGPDGKAFDKIVPDRRDEAASVSVDATAPEIWILIALPDSLVVRLLHE
jgi:hypothetical protein